MKISLSDRVQAIKPSPTLAISSLAATLKSQGRDIIGLGTGEPDFDTPEHIKNDAIEAIHQGQTKYTAVDGTPELKEAIINKFSNDNGLNYTADQVLVSSGGKQSFYNLCQALLNNGDEVIIPAPYWVSYPDMVILADATPVIVETGIQTHFKITPDLLTQNITEKTRLVVLNSPSNPTGVAYSNEELKQLGETLLKYPNVIVATDDMYEHILWADEKFSNILMACPELYERCIVLNGVSKAYAMTGWRIGYAAGPVDLIKAMKKIQSQSTSNPASISQAAAVSALTKDQHCVQEMLTSFKERHNFVYKTLNSIKHIECIPSDGTFYAFPKIQSFIDAHDDLESDVDVASLLLDKVGVAVIPGSAFGAEGYMRISYATSLELLTDALERIRSVFEA
ncbi:MAG: pyridoxal phosphate-dependent aminotransferase [Gammaproteobacteria bacterium]|nr:pyridoxal phosphate-dependent aminotransferase [Gammaproteobacteria bacterium]